MTAITAAYVPPSVALGKPPAIQLDLSGLPLAPTDAYTSNFTAGTNSWSLGGGPGTLTNDLSLAPDALRLQGLVDSFAEYTATRNIGSLTIGTKYRYEVFATKTTGQFRMAVKAPTAGTIVATSAYTAPTSRRSVVLEFTATEATMQIQLSVKVLYSRADGTTKADYAFDTISVRPVGTWLGNVITRTDVNGTAQVVRLSNRGDVPNLAGFSLYDWESAKTGVVEYTITDGAGVTATTSVDLSVGLAPAGGPWIMDPTSSVPGLYQAPANVHPELILDYSESREFNGSLHVIVGRADKVANSGPLLLRSGTFRAFCLDYADAVLIRDLVETGRPLWLTQPDTAGLDLYFIPRAVRLIPDDADTETRHWAVDVDYEEQTRP